MTQGQATALFGLLLASYPSARLDKTNQMAYVAFLVELPSEQTARAGIMDLIRAEEWLPSIAQIREAYARRRDEFAPPGLPEPEISEAERRANLRRLQALMGSLSQEMSLDERLDAVRRAGEDETSDA